MGGVDDRTVRDSAVWHLMRHTLSMIAAERPLKPSDAVESYVRVAHSGRAIPAPISTMYMDSRRKPKPAFPVETLRETQWATKFVNQVAPPKQKKINEDGEEEEEAPEEDKGELPDIVSEQSLFQAFGEGLPEADAYRITVALKRLLDSEPLSTIRFWGKIIGINHDYYIAESKIDENRVPEKEEAVEETPEAESGKPPETIYQALNTYRAKEPPRILAEESKGTNEFKYYVATSDDLSNWVQLPDVLPSQIIAARRITKLFTGNLAAPVETLPAFPGSERHYLRAQIARISHATLVCPKDTFVQEQPEEEDEDDEGTKKPKRFEVPAPEEVPSLNPTEPPDASDADAVAPLKSWFFGFKEDELLEPRLWVHMAPQLLAQGRATVFKADEDAAQADDEPEDEPPTAPTEYVNPFLSDVAHDKPLHLESYSAKSVIPWAVRKAFATEGSRSRKFLIRSLRWPGAMCVAETVDDQPGSVYQNVYIGRGIKSNDTQRVYAPPLPPLPSVEFPVEMLHLSNDGTRDDELEFEPEPPKPTAPGAEDEENAEDDA